MSSNLYTDVRWCFQIQQLLANKSHSSFDTVLEVCRVAISHQVWRKARETTLWFELQSRCPHICPPCQRLHRSTPVPIGGDSRRLSISELNAVTLQYSRILSKITRLKALKTRRAKLIKENVALLTQATDVSSLNPRLLQNVMDGVCFQDLLSPIRKSSMESSILEEMHILSEILQKAEADQKDEDKFWRWISAPHESTGSNPPEKQPGWQLLKDVHSCLASIESSLVDIVQDKKAQIYESSSDLADVIAQQLVRTVTEVVEEIQRDFPSEHVTEQQPSCYTLPTVIEDDTFFIQQSLQLWQQMASDLVAVTDAQSPFRTTLHSLSAAHSVPETTTDPAATKEEEEEPPLSGRAEDVIVDDDSSDDDQAYETY